MSFILLSSHLKPYQITKQSPYVVRCILNAFSSEASSSTPSTSSTSSNPTLRLPITKIKTEAPIVDTFSMATANEKQKLKVRIAQIIQKLQIHGCDTGSTSVQIAVLTEKIKNLARHFASNKKDYASMRGYWAMIQGRRSLLKYLRRKNFNTYKSIVKMLNLEREDKKITTLKS